MSTQLPALDNTNSRPPKEQYVVANLDYERRENTDDEIDLRELFLVIRRRKGTILLITVLVFIVALFVTLRIQPTYKATTTIQIDSEESGKFLDFEGITGDSGNREFFQTQYELLKSRILATRVIKDLGLEPELESQHEEQTSSPIMATFTNFQKDLKDLATWGQQDRIEYPLGVFSEEQKFLTNLSIAPVKKSKIVAISYTSKDPQFATDAANAVAHNFIAMTRQRKEDAGEHAREFLNDKVRIAQKDLADAEKKLNDYAEENAILLTHGERSASFESEQVAALNLALAKAKVEQTAARSQLNKLQRSGAIEAVEKNPNIQKYKSQITALNSDYERLSSTYKDSYPTMRSLKRKIRRLERALQSEINHIRKNTEQAYQNRYQAAKQTYTALSAQLAQQKGSLQKQRGDSIQYGKLLRDIETMRQVYQSLFLRSTEIEVASGATDSNIAIVDKATLPYAPQKPNVKLNLALGAVLGMFMGIVAAFLLEFLDDRVKSSDELKRILGLPLLGLTPAAKGKDPIVHSLTTAEQPKSALAEAFRSLRTNLLFSSVDGTPKVLALTSAMPSEGKSSSCINLATAFAQAGNKVLLVDADMRKPTVHTRLKLDNSQGLSSYLTGQSDIEEVIQTTLIDNVSAITAGPSSPNPSELLSSKYLEIITHLAPEQFDLVILDCPPVMGLADAAVLANKANATILVSAFGQTSKRAIQDAHERLKQARANVIGVVFSKVKSGSSYGYSNGYYADYSYGEKK